MKEVDDVKKFLMVVAASLILFSGQTEAAPVDDLNVSNVEKQEVKKHGKWAHFRDKYLLGRETENERRDRKEWEKKHRYDPPRYRYDPPPTPPPPPPPVYRNGKRYYPPPTPPPPPVYRDGRRYYPPPTYPPPPPTRRR